MVILAFLTKTGLLSYTIKKSISLETSNIEVYFTKLIIQSTQKVTDSNYSLLA